MSRMEVFDLMLFAYIFPATAFILFLSVALRETGKESKYMIFEWLGFFASIFVWVLFPLSIPINLIWIVCLIVYFVFAVTCGFLYEKLFPRNNIQSGTGV